MAQQRPDRGDGRDGRDGHGGRVRPDRRHLALAGYVSGPAAATEATVRAHRRVAALDPATVVLVEGISDQIAVEALARRQGIDLDAAGAVVVPIGGAQAITAAVHRFSAEGDGRRLTGRRLIGRRLVGLCDEAEAPVFARAVERVAPSGFRFHVCLADLEDELIRAVGLAAAEALLERQGDLGSFRTLQKQPAWRGREPAAQLRRFIGAGSRRKSRYGRLLVETLDPARVPAPLQALMDDVGG